MKTIQQVCDQIVGNEGKFVDDPQDAGGPTMYGISLLFAKSLPKVNGRSPMDLNGDGVVDIKDIKLVTKAIAEQLYLDHFYRATRTAELPECIQPCIMDMNVNAGAGGGGKVLQMALISQSCLIAIDGEVGDFTIRAAQAIHNRIGDKAMVNAVVAARIGYYERIVQRNPSQRKFLNGWKARAEEFAR